jgi:hypothetical protein
MSFKKLIISSVLAISSLQAFQASNAAVTNYWTYINQTTSGVVTTCYWKRPLLNSSGQPTGQYEYYNFIIVSLSSCFNHTNQLPR